MKGSEASMSQLLSTRVQMILRMILPYARTEDLIVVTNNVLDFKPLADDEHAGIVIVYDNRLSAFQIATELFRIMTAYQTRDAFPGKEAPDDWIE